jgi:thioester reductase-like protein
MSREEGITVLTGATGFVGSVLLERLIARGTQVVALVRAEDDAEAQRRLEELATRTWGDRAVVAGVGALAADLEHGRFALSPGAYDALASRAAAIVHCAAAVRFDLPLEEAEAINVAGTEQVVQLAERARALGAEGRLVHVSTAFVHGRTNELGREVGPTGRPEFRNTYEMTKHRAEAVVKRLEDATIVRPSIVVGDSLSGWTSSFNVIYPPLRALLDGALEVVPGPADGILDLVPVDQVVDVLCAALDDPAAAGVIQAVGGEMAPTIEEFASLAYAHAGLPRSGSMRHMWTSGPDSSSSAPLGSGCVAPPPGTWCPDCSTTRSRPTGDAGSFCGRSRDSLPRPPTRACCLHWGDRT